MRSALDLVTPNLHKRVEREQEWQKATMICSFKVEDQSSVCTKLKTRASVETWICQRSNGSSKIQSKAVEWGSDVALSPESVALLSRGRWRYTKCGNYRQIFSNNRIFSPSSFCIMRNQQKMLKQLPQIPIWQQMKVREEHVVTHYRIVDLRTDTPE